MEIAICDDEKIFRDELRTYLVEYKKDKRLQLNIYEFTNGNDLCETNMAFDMVFLDYQMPCLDGMETARILRKRNAFCSIVFVTNYPDFVFDSFEVSPYRFLKKPINLGQIESLLTTYVAYQKALAPIIINDYDGQKIIESKDIIYLEGDGKYCVIRTTTETVHSSKTLAGVLELLPQYCFFRVHKTYAVNLYCVQQIIGREILLKNGEKVLLSRNKVTNFKTTYKQFIKDYYLRA
jgi:two-component system LytT family response regulator